MHRVPRIGSHAQRACAAKTPGPAFLLNFDYRGHWREKSPFQVDRDRRVTSVALENPCDIRIPENGHVTRISGFQDELFSLAVYRKAEGSKGVRRSRILFPEPCRTGIFRLKDLQDSFARPQNFLPWFPHARQFLLHQISGSMAPGLRLA